MRLIRYVYPSEPTLNDLEQAFGAAFPAFSRCANAFDSLVHNATGAVGPATELSEDSDSYHAKVELPGVRKEDISLTLENGVVAVAAKRVEKTKDAESTTEYSRKLPLPEDVDADKVSAAYENGVLTLTLPKQEARKPRAIEVK